MFDKASLECGRGILTFQIIDRLPAHDELRWRFEFNGSDASFAVLDSELNEPGCEAGGFGPLVNFMLGVVDSYRQQRGERSWSSCCSQLQLRVAMPGALEPFELSVSMGGYEWECKTVLTVEPAALERFVPELCGLVRYANDESS